MAWTPPKKWRPQENFTASDLNTYVRDNQAATLAGQTPIADGIACTTGPNAVTFRAIRTGSMASTTTTTSATPVSVGPSISTINSSGRMLVMFTAEIQSSTTAQFANFCIGYSTGGMTSISRAVTTSSTERMSLSAHIMYYEAPTTLSLDGWLWSTGGATATLYRASATIWVM